MNNVLLSQEAFINYFSELLGIVVTVLLIPIILKIFLSQKNKGKRFIGKHLIIEKINRILEEFVPQELQLDDSAHFFYKRLDSYLIPFELSVNNSELHAHFFESFISKDQPKSTITKKTKAYLEKLKIFRSELFDIISNYGDTLPKGVMKEIYKIDYNIQSQEYINSKDDIELDGFAETLTIVIYSLVNIRQIILGRGKKHYLRSMDFMFEKTKNASA